MWKLVLLLYIMPLKLLPYLGIDKRYIEHYIYLNTDKPVLGKYTFNEEGGEDINSFNFSKKNI